MGDKGNISSYRDMLDKTLASQELKNEERLKALVKNQILQSSQVEFKECINAVVERRTNEVSNFLDMLRSASVDDAERLKTSKESHGAWKVKQDTEEIRVMYREGPEGTPFHTLLVEGYVDGPVDVCLCISCESPLYQKWWPQTSVPTFKITSSQCLQKVRIGEQISLVRMKVSWPLSSREALVHYFVFEYFQDGLVVVLLNSISDLETIDKSIHGFSRDGLPDAEDVVRIDVVGGFALQKVTAGRSYFRTIANMDIKLDFVPPAFINFISRQLIGSGFKLYKKEVASVSHGDEDFGKALKDPLYEKIREALYSDDIERLESDEIKQDTSAVSEGKAMKYDKDTDVEEEVHSDDHVTGPNDTDLKEMKTITLGLLEGQQRKSAKFTSVEEKVHSDGQTATKVEEEKNDSSLLVEESPSQYMRDAETEEIIQSDANLRPAEETIVGAKEPLCEIEEVEEEDTEKKKCAAKDGESSCYLQNNQTLGKNCTDDKTKVCIRPEVEKALDTLEKAIEIIRQHKSNVEQRSLPSITSEKPKEENAAKKPTDTKADDIHQNGGALTKFSKKEPRETTIEPRNSSGSHGSRRSGSNSYARDSHHSKVAPASPDVLIQDLGETHHAAVYSSENRTLEPCLEKIKVEDNTLNYITDGVNEEKTSIKKKKKLRYCCLHYIY